MKTIYFYDTSTKSFMYSDLIKDEVEIPVNATTIQPEVDGRGMYDPTWDGEKWVELSESDWIAKHKNDPQEPANPSDTDSTSEPNTVDQLKLMVGNLVAENAKKDQAIKQLQTMTGSLVAQIAELNKGGK
ncbi:hypothetical protein [Latilactobacillus sakei]|uniref:hypothetical protein n=1 Tax=Latilactobacillus sakei TaxID=1599 RepID=UPI003F52E29B